MNWLFFLAVGARLVIPPGEIPSLKSVSSSEKPISKLFVQFFPQNTLRKYLVLFFPPDFEILFIFKNKIDLEV